MDYGENELKVFIEHGNYRTIAEMRRDVRKIMRASAKFAGLRGAKGVFFTDVELSPHNLALPSLKLVNRDSIKESGSIAAGTPMGVIPYNEYEVETHTYDYYWPLKQPKTEKT